MKGKKIQEKEKVNLQLQNKKKVQKLKEKGITLIALVVTIIILLILVGVTIAFSSGENGLIEKAKEARKAQIIGETKEAIGLEITEAYTEAVIRKEGLEKQQVEDIISKYGKLQEDGDTIITKKDGYKISLKEIYSGVLSESGSYGAKVEQIEMLEKELEELKEKNKVLEEANSGNTEGIKRLEEEKNDLEEKLEVAQNDLENKNKELEKKELDFNTEKQNLTKQLEEAKEKYKTLEDELEIAKATPKINTLKPVSTFEVGKKYVAVCTVHVWGSFGEPAFVGANSSKIYSKLIHQWTPDDNVNWIHLYVYELTATATKITGSVGHSSGGVSDDFVYYELSY